jgi:hypothetical protein
VKATGDQASPCVGVLKSEKHTYASHGDSPELAKQGAFECVRQVAITEIFRYFRRKYGFTKDHLKTITRLRFGT